MVTTAPDIKPHMDAVLAALRSAGLTVGEGGKPAGTATRYAVVYFDPGRSLTESLGDQRTDFVLSFQVTCVGPNQTECLWVAQRTRQALHGPLTVAGRSAWRPIEDGGPPVQRDDDVSPPLYFLPVQYRLQSTA